MTTPNDRAFACSSEYGRQFGLTVREYFAAQALIGYLALYAGDRPLPRADEVARASVDYADALIAALSKPPPA